VVRVFQLRVQSAWLTLVLCSAFSVFADPPSPKLNQLLPLEIGQYHQQQLTLRPLLELSKEGFLKPENFRKTIDSKNTVPFVGGEVDYLSPEGDKLRVEILSFDQASDAYAFFTQFREAVRQRTPQDLNSTSDKTASLTFQNGLVFSRGGNFLRITKITGRSKTIESAKALAQLFVERLAPGEDDIPVLVKHLPDWQNVEPHASFAIDSDHLKASIVNQPILEAVAFDGGAEAVTAPYYGSAQMTLVEFTTPQLATENDQRIVAKIQELRAAGQPVPIAYRRVGNYSVFVFNAATEQAANQLIDQIKYEQVVQWLGDNPNWLKQAQREYTETTLGVLVTVIKTSGLAAIVCFGVGGFLGAVMFARRRARQIDAQAFSDAGGMMRLNLDDMKVQTDSSKLIESGE